MDSWISVWADKDGTPAPIKIDDSVGSLITLDHAHHEIHEGNFHSAFHTATGKNDGDTISIFIETPATSAAVCHAFFDWSSSCAAYGRVRECGANTVTTNTGTSAAIINHNRNSTNASLCQDNSDPPPYPNYFMTDVTLTTVASNLGTIVLNTYAGSAKNQGGISRSNNEIILKGSTKYNFEVESDAASGILGANLYWYEE